MEAEAFLATMKDLRLPDGRGRVVRHDRTFMSAICIAAIVIFWL
jgi:hypothetical protein